MISGAYVSLAPILIALLSIIGCASPELHNIQGQSIANEDYKDAKSIIPINYMLFKEIMPNGWIMQKPFPVKYDDAQHHGVSITFIGPVYYAPTHISRGKLMPIHESFSLLLVSPDTDESVFDDVQDISIFLGSNAVCKVYTMRKKHLTWKTRLEDIKSILSLK